MLSEFALLDDFKGISRTQFFSANCRSPEIQKKMNH